MKNPMSMQGQTVLVTGAGQGVGAAVSELIIELGGKVVLLDVKEDELRALADRLGSENATAYVGSVTDPAFVEATVRQAAEKYGAITGLVNNAGIIRTAMIEKMSKEYWDQVIDVNLTGVYLCLQTVGRHMLERIKDGDTAPAAIVNVSSVAGRRGAVGQINYAAAKSGVLGMTMAAAKEWGRHGIRVNSACFGVVSTEMTEVVRSEKFRDAYMKQIVLQRFSDPEEVAKSVVFMLSDAASYITGQHISIDGGLHIGF
ncbi:SDR family NAD(P)-dependent oxidoreductase [Sneathiella aquimaris]|uniref:SDR family NAD(P)-dependent oxidoreductase n=1 Tax=Sneathiella aquimaris TaxID=2599305 RepID=UPI00146B5216|nr:SDR family NAD(P)-dependent oxidoreductase [Sneathiella aquimaris]